MEIVTGKDDEVCDWQLAQRFAKAMKIAVSILDEEGHMIATKKVSSAIDNFLQKKAHKVIGK